MCRRIAFIILLVVFVNQSYADEILWESGVNLFIKITEQDKSKSGKTLPNNHPVTLNEKDIREALGLIEIWTKNFYKGENAEKVFPFNIARLLGEHVGKGLQIANPNEDIIFTLVKQKKGTLGDRVSSYLTGRIFFLDNQLNIIIGDYDNPGDKLKEIVYGEYQEVRYSFKRASRAKPSKKFKENTMVVEGITNHKVGSKLRRDWFIIDLEKTKQVITANKNIKRKSSDEYKQSLEKAKLAKERREMRLEMARIRQEMKKNKNTGSTSIEERLENLSTLKQKGLISDEEYEKKRIEILNDI